MFKRRDLDAGTRESYDVSDVGTLGADYRADAVVRNVQEGRFLSVAGRDSALLGWHAALVRVRRRPGPVEAWASRTVSHTCRRHHRHRVQSGEHHALWLQHETEVGLRASGFRPAVHAFSTSRSRGVEIPVNFIFNTGKWGTSYRLFHPGSNKETLPENWRFHSTTGNRNLRHNVMVQFTYEGVDYGAGRIVVVC